MDDGKGLSTQEQQYHDELLFNINGIREQVDRWRELPQSQWQVTAATARLLQHWRGHGFSGIRPFFCQINDWIKRVKQPIRWKTCIARDMLDLLKYEDLNVWRHCIHRDTDRTTTLLTAV